MDDGTYKGIANGNDAWAWDSEGHLGLRMFIHNVSEAAGLPVSETGHLWFEDRSDGTGLNKLYFSRNGDIILNDVWVCERTYICKLFDDPDSVLSRT